MRIKVMKFGGTSVATPEARNQAVLRVISAKEQGFMPVVVVSAIGRKGAPYATDTLLNLLRDVDPHTVPEPRELDLLIACGEILSAVIFAHSLKSQGHLAHAFRGGQAGIRTDGVYGNARITTINPSSLLRCAESGAIPVVCGFQGVFVDSTTGPGGELTTLGRGGSDTTAAALGCAMKAECVEIYTDVDGVKTADPDAVSHAPTLSQITYDEVAEIAHLGAKVVHPRAAEIAMKTKLPLWIKNTFSDHSGTLIIDRSQKTGRQLTGVAHTGQLVYLQFNLDHVSPSARAELEAKIYEMMSKNDVNLYMVNVSPNGTGFGIPRTQLREVDDLLDALVIPVQEGGKSIVHILQLGSSPSQAVTTQTELLGPLGEVRIITVDRTEGCTMVSLVGDEKMREPGLFFGVLSTLYDHQIPVLQTSDSDLSLSVLVPESDCLRAVRLIHDKYQLEQVT